MSDIISTLSEVLNPLTQEQDATAAVTLLLHPVGSGFEILFVKRVKSPADPWSGQIALPGGKRDAHDKTLKDTAVREALEETDINLGKNGYFLGVLDVVRSVQMPEVRILPFVVFMEERPNITLNTKELERYFWILLDGLIQNKGTVNFRFGEFPAYIVDGNVIWGLTYAIIEQIIPIFHSI
jgi:8-oxo-dGTP pyrophosphatase MutT (NUDIX family)